MRSLTRVALAAGVAVLAVACSGGSGGDDGGGGGDGAEAAPTDVEVEVEAFTGPVEAFYDVPDPLPPGEPGDLVRTMPLEAEAGEVGLRIMYHSTDANGDDRAVTGVVYHPAGEPPEGGWPIHAWAHGTSGLAPACAPSRVPQAPPRFGIEGVHVATDYVGLGPEGELHPYLSAAAEANAVIDGVAAARALPDAHAGDRWVATGHSQGGHAALITNEWAAERLPDVELLGTVAVAPGAELGTSHGDDLQIRIITALALFGAAQDDPSIDPRDYLNPEAYAATAEVVTDGCIGDVITALPGLAADPGFFTTDPRTTDLGAEWLEANDPGQVVSASPLLLVQGGADALVVPARTDALQARLCGLGQVVDRLDLPTATHDTELTEGDADIAAWLAARLAGDPPTDDC